MNVIARRVRDGFGELIDPLAVVFIRLHIRPNLVPPVGMLVVIASATAFGLGWVRPGGLLLLVSGLFDLLDGRVARRADMTTTFGAFYDSTLDRVGEAALFGGIRSEEHTSELQSQSNLVCRLLLEKKKKQP